MILRKEFQISTRLEEKDNFLYKKAKFLCFLRMFRPCSEVKRNTKGESNIKNLDEFHDVCHIIMHHASSASFFDKKFNIS
jgi:hypothetical protein